MNNMNSSKWDTPAIEFVRFICAIRNNTLSEFFTMLVHSFLKEAVSVTLLKSFLRLECANHKYKVSC